VRCFGDDHNKAAGCRCSSANHGMTLCPLANGHLPTTHLATVHATGQIMALQLASGEQTTATQKH